MPQLRCFVAMALGRRDTDAFYDRSLVPTFKGQNVAPRRIDRLNHNDDIDDRIISELRSADFVLADLTYARPSVYFEAGFAEQRGVPVIYTCRGDHFKARQNDSYGNFRVHFDLQMKNIIPWTRPNDTNFAKKLARRISYVTRPIIKEKQRRESATDDERMFTALPIEQRIDMILNTARRRLLLSRYKGILVDEEALRSRYAGPPEPNWRYGSAEHFIHYHFESLSSLNPGWRGQKLVRGILSGVSLHVTTNLIKNNFKTLSEAVIYSSPHDLAVALQKGPLHELREYVFLISLRALPLERVMSWLSRFRLDRSTKLLLFEEKLQVPTSVPRGYKELYIRWGNVFVACNPSKKGRVCDVEVLRSMNGGIGGGEDGASFKLVRVPRRVHVYVFDKLKSLQAFREGFENAVKGIEIKTS